MFNVQCSMFNLNDEKRTHPYGTLLEVGEKSPFSKTGSLWLKIQFYHLRPPGGSITVFSTLFDKAVLLSYALAFDTYNPMVLYAIGPLKFPSCAKSGLSVRFWQCIMKHSSL